MGVWALPELIEAAARNDEPERASAALERLSAAADASGTHWALGLEARSRALVSADALADPLYRKAIDHLSRTRARFDLTRAHLVYGEWLRRQKRRLDAREHLRIADEMFAAMGFDAFAERSAREVRAAGGTATVTSKHAVHEAERHLERLSATDSLIASVATTQLVSSCSSR